MQPSPAVLSHARLGKSVCLEQLVLQSHVVLRLESDAGTEDVGEARTLLGESVDNGSALGHKRSLFPSQFNSKMLIIHYVP
jgi:hypothetical protein